MAKGWSITLNGVTVSGGDDPCAVGCLTVPPDGMGPPDMRDEDVVYPQSDGVRHFDDWYMPRIITMERVIVSGDGCPGCISAREKLREIRRAWARQCEDVELVVWPDCDGGPGINDGALTGPFGVLGRPRVSSYSWTRQGYAVMLLRFDAADHRMYVLDADGTPGSGEKCVSLTPDTESVGACAPFCFGEGPELLATNLHHSPFFPNGVGLTTQFRSLDRSAGVSGGGPIVAGAERPYFTLTATGEPTTVGLRVWLNGAGAPDMLVSPNQVLYVSTLVRNEGGAVGVVRDIEWRDSSNTGIGVWTDSVETPVGNEWTAISYEAVVPENAAWAKIRLGVRDWAVGNAFHVSGVLATVDGYHGEPFSGDFADTPTGQYEWIGDPHASGSRMLSIPEESDGTLCFTTDLGQEGGGPVNAIVRGDICVQPTITLYGQLTNPIITNLTTGARIGYTGTIGTTSDPVVIDTQTGSATQGGSSRNHLISGDPRMILEEGENVLRLSSYSGSDSGRAEVCWRDAVLGA